MEVQKLINCNNSWTQVSLFISKACYDAKHALWQKLTTQLRKASRLKLNRLKCRSQFAKNHGSTLHQSLRRTLKAKQQELLILHDKLTQHHSMTRESMVETCNNPPPPRYTYGVPMLFSIKIIVLFFLNGINK